MLWEKGNGGHAKAEEKLDQESLILLRETNSHDKGVDVFTTQQHQFWQDGDKRRH